jgi:hypothetical protein
VSPVDLRLSFAKPTSAAYIYNWTAPGGPVDLAFEADVRAGSVEARLNDPSNKTLFTATVSASGKKAFQIPEASGKWQVRLLLTGFQGNLTLRLTPAATPSTTTSTTGPAVTAGGTTTTVVEGTTGPAPGGTETTTKAAPALGVSALALAFAVLVAARRRPEQRE